MDTVLILGGYGAVGREAAAVLTGHPGTRVIVAGRNPGLLAVAGRPAVARLLRRRKVRDLLLRVLEKVHLGSDGFALHLDGDDRGTAR